MAFLFWEGWHVNKKRLGWSIAAVLLVAATASFAAPQGEKATAGWFLKEIATARGLSAPTEAEAAQVLKAAGIAVPSLDPAGELTEKDAVAIGNALGFKTTTQYPDATLSRARANALLVSFQADVTGSEDSSASTRDAGGQPNPNSDNGKGKKKGHNKSPSEPL